MAKNVQCIYCENLGIRFNENHEPYDWCDKVVDSPDALANRDCDYFAEIKTVRTKCPICGGEMWWYGGNHACKECRFMEPRRNMTYSDLTEYLATAIKRCKPMKTNGDRIRAMTDYDLADWIAEILTYHGSFPRRPLTIDDNDCPHKCPLYKCCNDQPSDNIEDWLKSPVEVDNGT